MSATRKDDAPKDSQPIDLNGISDTVEAIAIEAARLSLLVGVVAAGYRPLDMFMNYVHMSEQGLGRQALVGEMKEILRSPSPQRAMTTAMLVGGKKFLGLYSAGMVPTLQGAAIKNALIAQKKNVEHAVTESASSAKTQDPTARDDKSSSTTSVKNMIFVSGTLGAIETVLTQPSSNKKLFIDAHAMVKGPAIGALPKPEGVLQHVRFATGGLLANFARKSLIILPYMIMPVLKEEIASAGVSDKKSALAAGVVAGTGSAVFSNGFEVLYKHQVKMMAHDFRTMSLRDALAEVGVKGLGRGLVPAMILGVAGQFIVRFAEDVSSAVITEGMDVGSKIRQAKEAERAKQAEQAAVEAKAIAKVAKEAEELEQLGALSATIERGYNRPLAGLVMFFYRSESQAFHEAKKEFSQRVEEIRKTKEGSPEFLASVEKLDQGVGVITAHRGSVSSSSYTPSGADYSDWVVQYDKESEREDFESRAFGGSSPSADKPTQPSEPASSHDEVTSENLFNWSI